MNFDGRELKEVEMTLGWLEITSVTLASPPHAGAIELKVFCPLKSSLLFSHCNVQVIHVNKHQIL